MNLQVAQVLLGLPKVSPRSVKSEASVYPQLAFGAFLGWQIRMGKGQAPVDQAVEKTKALGIWGGFEQDIWLGSILIVYMFFVATITSILLFLFLWLL